MGDYRILIRNRSGTNRRYMILVDAPQVSSGPRVHQCVYSRLPEIPSPEGSAMFVVPDKLYIVVGTKIDVSLDVNVTVTASDWEAAAVARADVKGTCHFVTAGEGGGGSAKIATEKTVQECEDDGCFSIECDKSVSKGAGHFVGLGAQDRDDHTKIVAVAVWEAEASVRYVVKPMTKYYVVGADFRPGELVDVERLDKPFEVDFSNYSDYRQFTGSDYGHGKLQDVTFSRLPGT